MRRRPDTDRDLNSECDTDKYAHFDSYSERDSDKYTDGYFNDYRICDADSNGDSHRDGNAAAGEIAGGL